jgi:hypothetical protein
MTRAPRTNCPELQAPLLAQPTGHAEDGTRHPSLAALHSDAEDAIYALVRLESLDPARAWAIRFRGDARGTLYEREGDGSGCRRSSESHDGGGDHPVEPVAARVGDVGRLIGHSHPGSGIHRAGEDVEARRPGIEDDGYGPPSAHGDLHRGRRASWLTLAPEHRDRHRDLRRGPSGRRGCLRDRERCQTDAEQGGASGSDSPSCGFRSGRPFDGAPSRSPAMSRFHGGNRVI